MARFKQGKSGNPNGRPKGKGKQTTYRQILDANSKPLIQKLVDLAIEGDTTALSLCINRLIAPLKPRELPVELETVEGSLTDQGQAIFSSMASGKLTPSEATALISSLASLARITETDELEKRITELESRGNP